MTIATKDQIKFLEENYPIHGGIFCAEKTGLNHSYINYFCAKHGIKRDKEILKKENIAWGKRASEKSKLANKNKKFEEYDVNPEHFLNIKTPEVAYILGLLWADGYIADNGAIRIEAAKDDLEIVYPFFLKTGTWNIWYRQRKGRVPMAMINKGCTIISEFLKQNDYNIKSGASADKILSKIPEHLKHYWFRGLIDGDGCFYVDKRRFLCQMTITSSFEQDWTFVENLYNQLGLIYKINRVKRPERGKITGSSCIRIVNKDDIKKLGEYIYQGYEVYKMGYPRKYEKWLYIKFLSNTRKVKRGIRNNSQINDTKYYLNFG